MLRNRVLAGVFAGMLGVVLATMPAAFADGHGGHGKGQSAAVRGTVTAFTLPTAASSTAAASDGSLTLTEGDGTTVTLDITPATTIDMSAGSIAALLARASGQQVAVAVGGGSGTAVALTVRGQVGDQQDGDQGDGQFGQQHSGVSGVVQSVAAGSFTLQRENGATVTVAMLPTTQVEMGNLVVAAGNITAGMRVEVFGALNADGSLNADIVRISNPNADQSQSGSGLNGTVASAPAGSPGVFTVTTKAGMTVRVNLAANTIIRVGDRLGTLQDIVAGGQVQVFGTPNADGSFTAMMIKVSHDQGENGAQGGGD